MSKESDDKVLRIGLIQNGKIVEEQLVRARETVSIGQDFDANELVVPVADLPQSFPIFGSDEDGYYLNFTSEMEGRVASNGDLESLDDLRRGRKAEKGEHGHRIDLPTSSRGRVQIGEVTLLFQFVEPPPERPEPVLPASMRGGWFRGVERTLIATMVVSAIIQIGFVVFVQTRDWPEPKKQTGQIPDRFVEIDKKKKVPEPPKKKKPKELKTKEKAEGKSSEEKKSESSEKKDEPKKKKKDEMSPEEKAKKEAKKQRQMAKEVRNKTIIGQLGTISKKGEGSVADVLDDGAGKKSMEQAFKDSEGITSGSGAEKSGLQTSGSSDAEGSGESAGIGDLGKSEGAKEAEKGVGTGEKEEKKVEANVDLKTPERTAGRGQLDSSSIRSVIKRYSSRIQRCYERRLKVDSSASGKVVVFFTIAPSGTVSQAKAKTDSVGGNVGDCVAGVIQGLRFPKPEGGQVMVNKTFVFQAGG